MLIVQTAPSFLPEKQYALDVLLRESLGLSFRLEPMPDVLHYRIKLPNDSILTLEDHFFGRLVQETYLDPANVPQAAPLLPHPFLPGEHLNNIFGRPFFDEHTCGLDLVSSAFFMLTRWEEYIQPVRDRHARFPAEFSLAARAGFLRRPVVDEYAALLGQMLAKLGLPLPDTGRRYRLHLSHDVDHPKLWWTPRDRWRTLAGSLLRRLNPSETLFWLKNGQQDPFDTFDWIMDSSEKNGLVSQFNFMGQRPESSDCWYSLHHPFVQNLLEKIARRGHLIGFHPSYEAFDDEQKFHSELASLRAVSPLPVSSGRQHYLRFAPPETWQRWADAGLNCDSTLGYAEEPGFRCGTCHEFPVFHFLSRKVLPLREKPLFAMDVTFARYRGDTPEQALKILAGLRQEVQKHRGEFTLLWHNSSLNDYFWRPWRRVYESFISS